MSTFPPYLHFLVWGSQLLFPGFTCERYGRFLDLIDQTQPLASSVVRLHLIFAACRIFSKTARAQRSEKQSGSPKALMV